METLAIIAYHEPVTRAEIEEVRGVAISKGTLDLLMEAGWVRAAGRRESPGRPLQFATTSAFLAHFGLESRRDLPGVAELKAAGLLDPAPMPEAVDAVPAPQAMDAAAADADAALATTGRDD
jgi:segregation and condensation protein B